MTADKHSFSLALVTGASSGIGEAVCHLLATKKIDLIISGRNVAKLNAIAVKLRHQIKITVIPADLAEAQGRAKLVETIYQYKPDLVINDAGFGLYGDALTYETESQMEILTVNGNAVLELTLEAARAMISEGKTGTILNVSSVAGMMPGFPAFSVYAAAKSFVNHLSVSLDFEMRPNGVRVLCACPGMVATQFRQRAGGKQTHEAPPPPQKNVMTPFYAAEEIWKQIQSGKTLHVFNWKYRLIAYLIHLFPTNWALRIMRKGINKRHAPRSIIKRDSAL